jgi:hypothetical protein
LAINSYGRNTDTARIAMRSQVDRDARDLNSGAGAIPGASAGHQLGAW